MPSGRNVVRDWVETRPAAERALVVEDADGTDREWTFGELSAASGSLAGVLAERGVRRGDVVMTLVGNRVEYVLTILACLRIGAAVLPCTEQLRPGDLALRLRRAEPVAIVCDARNLPALDAAEPRCPVLVIPDDRLGPGAAPAAVDLGPLDPAFVLFTSGTSGEPKLVTHGQRYVWGQQLQATSWLGAKPGELVWSTAAPGWSKSARNTFFAPWFCGAAAMLQNRRFNAAERLETIRRHNVNVLCMAPTEYRLIAAAGLIGRLPSLRRLVTAGEALGPAVIDAWQRDTGLLIADGYGQTETGHLAGVAPGDTAPPGSMGRPAPGVRVEIVEGELTVDPATVPTFFLGYDGEAPPDGSRWHTGDLVRQDQDGWLYFESRADDVIVSSGYRIGPAEVETVLARHAAVREVAVVGTPDEQRGSLVTAFVVVRDGFEPTEELARELQEHVKAETAPYKYPRRVQFVDELPMTSSGKIARAALRTPPPH
ncbi:MAG TPA: AMP-binding protein [Jatrophihabitantaceae bacterium]|nr:AMP-binding protein [Jatrophihabitantaceae bacterium]